MARASLTEAAALYDVVSGQAVVLGADGLPEAAAVQLPAGLFLAAPGVERLNREWTHVQAELAAARAGHHACLVAREPLEPGLLDKVSVSLALGGLTTLALLGVLVLLKRW